MFRMIKFIIGVLAILFAFHLGFSLAAVFFFFIGLSTALYQTIPLMTAVSTVIEKKRQARTAPPTPPIG